MEMKKIIGSQSDMKNTISEMKSTLDTFDLKEMQF